MISHPRYSGALFIFLVSADPPANVGLIRAGLMLASRGVSKVHAATFASVHDFRYEGKQIPNAYALLVEDHRRETQVGDLAVDRNVLFGNN